MPAVASDAGHSRRAGLVRVIRRSLLVMTCAVTVAACGSSVSKDTFKRALVEDANLSEPVAQCVTDELYRRLDDEQIKRVYSEERAALTQAERNAVSDAAVLCVAETPADVPPEDGG